MIFGVAWTGIMSSHFDFENLQKTESFSIQSHLCFGFSNWLLLVGEPATCTSKHICLTQYSISVVGFHTASLAPSCLLEPQYLHILLQDFPVYTVPVFCTWSFVLFSIWSHFSNAKNKGQWTVNYHQSLAFEHPYLICNDHCDWWLSKISFSLLFSKAVVCRCSSKHVLLEILQYSQVQICAGVLIKLQAFGRSLQKRLQHTCFPVNIAKLLRKAFLIEHLWWLPSSV